MNWIWYVATAAGAALWTVLVFLIGFWFGGAADEANTGGGQ